MIHFKYYNTFRSVLHRMVPLLTGVKGLLVFESYPTLVFCEGALTIRKYPLTAIKAVTITLSFLPRNIKQEGRNVQVCIA